jgi:hypothetical protein
MGRDSPRRNDPKEGHLENGPTVAVSRQSISVVSADLVKFEEIKSIISD